MNISHTRIAKVVALILTFVLTQILLGMTFAAPATDRRSEVTAPQAAAILTTQGNKPVTVNGASATSGTTVLTGAMIETPDGISATVTIPGQGALMIAGNTKLALEFSQGQVRVTVIQGCAVLNTKKGTHGEIDNAQGAIGKTDGIVDAFIDTCQKKGTGVVSPGTGTGTGAGTGGGLSTGAKVAIGVAVVGGGVGLAFALRGSNPSPSSPR